MSLTCYLLHLFILCVSQKSVGNSMFFCSFFCFPSCIGDKMSIARQIGSDTWFAACLTQSVSIECVLMSMPYIGVKIFKTEEFN